MKSKTEIKNPATGENFWKKKQKVTDGSIIATNKETILINF